jgi:hypothetical protein
MVHFAPEAQKPTPSQFELHLKICSKKIALGPVEAQHSPTAMP